MASKAVEQLVEKLRQRFTNQLTSCTEAHDEVTIEIEAANLREVAFALRDEDIFSFEQLIDLCGVDYSQHGEGTWAKPRYAIVYHLLSVRNNQRLRLRTFAPDEVHPRIPTVTDIWSCANWYEREAFDLYGVLFEGHPDLRRILTDYGFVGHPFRKDFPLSGHVEMRYDPEKRRVVYEPVSIEPRVLVPRVIRHDNRYAAPSAKGAARGRD